MSGRVSCLILAAFIARPALGDDVSPAQAATLTDHLLRGMRDSRERLRSGELTANGTKREKIGADHNQGSVDLYMAFEFAGERLRMDRSEPWLVGPMDKGVLKKVVRVGKFARTPSTTVTWNAGSQVVETTAKHRAKAPTYIDPFDVRSVGLLPLQSFATNASFESAMAMYKRSSPKHVRSEGSGIYCIEWRNMTPGNVWESVRKLWIDESRGYTPLKADWYLVQEGKEPEEECYQRCRANVTWEKSQDVWIPVSFHIQDEHPFAKKETEYSLVFSWNAVNQDVAPLVFTAEGFQIPTPVLHINNELGRPVVTNTPSGTILPKGLVAMPLAEIERQKWWAVNWPYIVTGFGFVLIVAVVVTLRIRRRRAAV